MVTGQYDTVLIPPMCLVEDKTWLISEYTTHGRLFKSRSSGSTQLPYRRHDPVTISCLSRAPMLELITLCPHKVIRPGNNMQYHVFGHFLDPSP